MRIKYTDNYRIERTLEVPDDTPASVIEFLKLSERNIGTLYRKESGNIEHFCLSEAEQFHRSLHNNPLGKIKYGKSRFAKFTKDILVFLRDNCTEKQKRRFYLYTIYNIPMKVIAYWESCTVESVDESILAVIKKIKKEFSTIPD